MAPILDDTPFNVKNLFETFTQDMAEEMRKEMMEINFDKDE